VFSLGFFYWCYFGAVGAWIPYWSVYLRSLGLTPEEIGDLLALSSITRIISPNVWGYFADRRGARMPIVRMVTGFAIFSFLGIFWAKDFWELSLIISIFTFFFNASLPQVETIVIEQIGTDRYGMIRVWGSAGFILVVLFLGPFLDRFGIQTIPWILLSLQMGLWLSSLGIVEKHSKSTSVVRLPFLSTMIRPTVIVFLLSGFLMQASHGPYYSFYSLYLLEHGYNRTIVSSLWALAVLSEVGIFIAKGLAYYEVSFLLRLTLLFSSLRWALIAGWPNTLPVLVFAQVLHAVTFGAYHATAIRFVHFHFTGEHRVRGQAMYGSFCYGAGGTFGSFYAGHFWDWIGSEATFVVAAILSMIAWVIASTDKTKVNQE